MSHLLDLSDADKATLVDAFTKMHETADWKEVLTTNSWTDAFMTGDEFGTYMDDQTKRVEDVLTTLGLA